MTFFLDLYVGNTSFGVLNNSLWSCHLFTGVIKCPRCFCSGCTLQRKIAGLACQSSVSYSSHSVSCALWDRCPLFLSSWLTVIVNSLWLGPQNKHKDVEGFCCFAFLCRCYFWSQRVVTVLSDAQL